ncbi:hypothetical protein P4V54_00460 [Brevibacillus nitrificans]|uniref:hypothetical protein n=1 Tax=Brevibacillus nitrificans TaxID=651560 RepID=UPI002E23A49F|nr:hypothetical protein [Brevibacillus nitrificans]
MVEKETWLDSGEQKGKRNTIGITDAQIVWGYGLGQLIESAGLFRVAQQQVPVLQAKQQE